MKNILFLLALFCFLGQKGFAQNDTTIVQTLTFADINKRMGTWLFPPASTSFEKILMYYTLKCDAATTWDQFPCGEWDYLTYSVVHDSTGIIDSTLMSNANFRLIGNQNVTPDSFPYTSLPSWAIYNNWLKETIIDSTISEISTTIGAGVTTSTKVLQSSKNKSRAQYIWKAGDLTAAGLSAGPITGIELNANVVGGLMKNFTVRMKNTTFVTMARFDNGTFYTMYQHDIDLTNVGANRINFTAPFNWNGTSNILIELSFENENAGTIDYELLADSLTNFVGISTAGNDKHIYCINDRIEVLDAANVFASIDSQITVSFWAYGDPMIPVNTCIFEGLDANNERVVNVHLPWDNNNVYWDAGHVSGGGNDRIFKAATANDTEGRWNHWIFTKNVATGTMKIYLNGTSWFSGTGKLMRMNNIEHFSFANTPKQEGYYGLYPGGIDDFQVWNKELDAATISAWYNKSVDASHPNYSNLVFAYDFENDMPYTLNDISGNNYQASVLGMPHWRDTKAKDLYKNGVTTKIRPQITWVQGNYVSHLDSVMVSDTVMLPKTTVLMYENTASPLTCTDTIHVYKESYNYIYTDGIKTDSVWNGRENVLVKVMNPYYYYFEKIDRYEIGRFITPYGIGLDLGADGFTWIYDVTDYAPLLHDWVTISNANTQELADVKFMFIEGTPSRSVMGIKPLHQDMYSASYNSMANDINFPDTVMQTNPNASTFKLVTRITGHGHEGVYDPNLNLIHCCEWADKEHNLTFNGAAAPQIAWDLLMNGACYNNPVIAQGGNWAPDRDGGWCPGMPVFDKNFDVTQYVQNNQIGINYGIEPVPANNTGQGSGNYVVTMHLIEYGQPNFSLDAEIVEIIRPSKQDWYSNINPICTQPVVKIRNNGTTPITSLTIDYGVKGGAVKTQTWGGNLQYTQTVEITLNMDYTDWTGTNMSGGIFQVELKSPNGGTDQYLHNSKAESEFALPPTYPSTFVVRLKNNALQGDVTCRIKSESGNTIYLRNNMLPNVFFSDTITFPGTGCYYMELTTQEGLGLNYPLIPEVGAGGISFRSATSNAILKDFNADFGEKITHHFTVNYALPIIQGQNMSNVFFAYPNPTKGWFTVELQKATRNRIFIEIKDIMGRMILSEVQKGNGGEFSHNIDLSNYPSGLYFVTVIDGENSYSQKIVKE